MNSEVVLKEEHNIYMYLILAKKLSVSNFRLNKFVYIECRGLNE